MTTILADRLLIYPARVVQAQVPFQRRRFWTTRWRGATYRRVATNFAGSPLSLADGAFRNHCAHFVLDLCSVIRFGKQLTKNCVHCGFFAKS